MRGSSAGHCCVGSQSREATGSIALGIPSALSREAEVLELLSPQQGLASSIRPGFTAVFLSQLSSQVQGWIERVEGRRILKQNPRAFPLPLLLLWLKDAQAARHWEGAAVTSCLSSRLCGKPAPTAWASLR